MMKLGAFVHMNQDIGAGEAFQKLMDMGLTTCQLACWQRERLTDAFTRDVNAAAARTGIEISAFWCGWGPPVTWDFYDGPLTLGLVPAAYRHERLETLIEGVEFARKIGVTDIATHVGYIPENPNDPDYRGVIIALKEIVRHCRGNGQYFLFETGQETPVTLRRAIEDLGGENVGINLDPANLLMYGKANPVDALDVFGQYVRGVHAKDGEYPTDGRRLGVEKRLGEGRVNFPAFIRKLKSIGYSRPITIEREIEGEEQARDILYAKELLTKLCEEE